MKFFEHDGGLFKGNFRSAPLEMWSRKQGKWIPYPGDLPKAIDWGSEITEAEAQSMMGAKVEA
jgi:hypothetical protein